MGKLINKVLNDAMEAFPPPVRTGRFREGVAIKSDDIDTWIVNGAAALALLFRCDKQDQIEGKHSMTEITQAYEEATTEISTAKTNYDKVVKDFRANIKNDLSSISAAATRVKTETLSMNKAYMEAIQTLTSTEMQTAIENAERLALALNTLANINHQQFSFELLNRGE